ncbi:hypothetical protein [Clostridium homopropionicum]|uniref:hypothetical protein n=1 Tax=Clostridium homopropionicum TaxID=36844 RepID=UPI00068D90E7|nr:hypothetical protein [Clostridium homopropionicum]
MRLKLIILTLITFLLLFYFTNHHFNIFIKSKLFSQHTHNVIYSDSKRMDIPLPPNSVWLFKTPTDVYYSKYNVKIDLIGDSDSRRYGISDPKY